MIICFGEKDNNTIKPNVLIFNKCKSIDKNNVNLTNLKNEIIKSLKECSDINRGYIVNQLLEDGWLKFDNDIININYYYTRSIYL